MATTRSRLSTLAASCTSSSADADHHTPAALRIGRLRSARDRILPGVRGAGMYIRNTDTHPHPMASRVSPPVPGTPKSPTRSGHRHHIGAKRAPNGIPTRPAPAHGTRCPQASRRRRSVDPDARASLPAPHSARNVRRSPNFPVPRNGNEHRHASYRSDTCTQWHRRPSHARPAPPPPPPPPMGHHVRKPRVGSGAIRAPIGALTHAPPLHRYRERYVYIFISAHARPAAALLSDPSAAQYASLSLELQTPAHIPADACTRPRVRLRSREKVESRDVHITAPRVKAESKDQSAAQSICARGFACMRTKKQDWGAQYACMRSSKVQGLGQGR
ncbi:hypothetical protein B0H13DRAFT_2470970 [Mycena leptocephala]|nr:hypothetical protein B0H13DRAFT_2470970 [Mycena leptocephala]